ncbi:unnamed protein product [Clonostachys rosea]|uniref:PHD finger domain protein n=1 Tax=Bionectria ochroleuca TaxID=29856 RepID=A0ABY6UTW5_BIOOC|nr:unnamed protein product [Clonostachys rosea]
MSGDRLSSSSFGDPNVHSSTPRQTPTTATFPSPVLSTPKQQAGQFDDGASWTPRFAEDYSVFNSTPGNLRAIQGPFLDSVSITHTDNSSTNKPLLSTGSSTAEENSFYKGLLSPDINLQLPYAETINSELPTVNLADLLNEQAPKPNSQSNLRTPKQASDKPAKQVATKREHPVQTVTPPPTTHKGRRKLAPRLKMQEDQSYGQPDLMDPSQVAEMQAFLGHTGDFFGYPMSAPVTAPENFWDPSTLNLPMDMDFSATPQNIFPQSGTSYHRPSGSFDWNNETPLFQTPQETAPTSSQETVRQPPRRERALAPKPPAPEQLPVTTSTHPMTTSFEAAPENPFGIVNHTGAVDPGMLLSRPQTSPVNVDFLPSTDLGLQGNTVPSIPARVPSADGIRRTASFKNMTEGKVPDRRLTRSPVKPVPARPNLGRSQSENRGRRSIARGPVVNQNAVARPNSQTRSGSGIESARPSTRASGRVSPLKRHRLSGLTSIPESASRGLSSASIRFTIDSNGRARAEAAHSIYDHRSNSARSRSSDGSQSWNESGDESSSDDEPIIIPSRTSSFNTSFALPDPLKPVGSIFHSSRRSISDRSTSTVNAPDTPDILIAHDAESEAETLMHDPHDQEGDAASELLKLIENRRNRSGHLVGAGANRLSASHIGRRSNSRSPASLNDIMEIRCVCHRNGTDENDGYMVRW